MHFMIAAIVVLTAFTSEAADYSVPAELLLPAPYGAIYVGDDLPCSAEREGLFRYSSTKALYVCSDNVWREVAIGARQ